MFRACGTRGEVIFYWANRGGIMKRKTDLRLVPPQFTPTEWEEVKRRMKFSVQLANVSALVLEGKADKNIARVLTISIPRVRDCFHLIFARAGAGGRVDLVLKLINVRDELRGNGLSAN
jgi:DNA-binding NarL/FixJ family response regulator